MNGLYVIWLVLVVGIWYILKIIYHSKLRNTEQVNIDVKKVKPSNYKWFSLFICLAATAILVKNLIALNKLTGAELAQSDFGMFFDFIVYAIPSMFLVAVSLYRHIKFKITKKINLLNIISDPFVILSVLVASLPIIVFVLSRLSKKTP